MATQSNQDKRPNKRQSQIEAVLIQLGSVRPSDVWRGMEQIRRWLRENPEDKDIYNLLLTAVKNNRELREAVRTVLVEMTQFGSNTAEQALMFLPSSVQDLLADADDAYYAAEYERAIQIYQRVLKIEPDNTRAKEHIAKSELQRVAGEIDTGLPRDAKQYYRRARSHIAARDIATAMNLLNAAIESAQAKGMRYPEAEDALSNLQNLITADEYRQRAKEEIKSNNITSAINLYNKSLTLDPANDLAKRELRSIQDLTRFEKILKQQGILKVFTPVNRLRKVVEAARPIMDVGTPLLDNIERQLNQIRILRTSGLIMFLVVALFPLYMIINFVKTFVEPPTNTPAIINVTNTFSGSTPTKTETPLIITVSPTNTFVPETATFSAVPASPTETTTSTFTPVPTGKGFINKAVASTWREPNNGLIGQLGLEHPLILLEKRVVVDTTWYRCRWEVDGTFQEGWVLGSNITITIPLPANLNN